MPLRGPRRRAVAPPVRACGLGLAKYLPPLERTVAAMGQP
jgi:hypothetical protein